ncbi:hypothetical protein PXD56_18500 [Maribacter sp. SA7]|uniref:hypothetical protein n=1 Tax=Maribacter zhoushanensis TaxID=3030012 RepID=UPI0023EDC6E5|nr:hypothetical protein [Maribacter zhoushanensis]MDF4204965.1 hypothetical protein [Maribacter zhoushanensis]
MKSLVSTILSLWFLCCTTDKEKMLVEESDSTSIFNFNAQVTEVSISGEPNAYTFNTTISSPDTGCDQYADWWEIIDLEGNLIYRRILTHSHVDEQPFTRSGSNIPLYSTTEVYIRVHMNTTSYSNAVLKGSIDTGFSSNELDAEFAKDLENVEPLPNGYAF